MKILRSAARAGLMLSFLLRMTFAMDGVNQNGGNPQADTPEPTTITLVAIGFAAGGYAWYRSRRNRH
jgi:hypothetical protein